MQRVLMPRYVMSHAVPSRRAACAGALLALLAACGRGAGDRETQTAAADSAAARDLQLAAPDSTRPLNDVPLGPDRPGNPPESVVVNPPPLPAPTRAEPAPPSAADRATRAAQRRNPQPAPNLAERERPGAPAPNNQPNASGRAGMGRTLASGTRLAATTDQEISSAANKVGDVVTATISEEIKDRVGNVVVPAGSTVRLRIDNIRFSENRSDRSDLLTLTTESIVMGGRSRPFRATIEEVQQTFKGRGGAIGDASKVAAGAGAGAVVGRVLGGKTGTIIGGVIGGAVGTQRAIETKDNDVVVPKGSRMTFQLVEQLAL